jgi:predicted alpha/beta-fold hydrolase
MSAAREDNGESYSQTWPARSFRPLPFIGNPHLQTLLAHVLPGPRLPAAGWLGCVLLPDGDRLAMHDNAPPAWQAGDGIVILVHGLGGCHRSGYMLRLTRGFLERSLRVIRVDLRGVGAGETLARRTYHGGCSGDLGAVVLEVARQSPASPMALVGMSLGGNIVLKLAGEMADSPHPVKAVAAVAPPIDMIRCAALLTGRPFYDRYFVRHILKQVHRHRRYFPETVLPRFPRRMTLRQLDDLWTAPRWGFADATDYYRRASALPLSERIRVPALVLTARDDPFIAVEPFETLRQNSAIQVHIADCGGHLGFLGLDGAGGIRWAERQVVDWIAGTLEH